MDMKIPVDFEWNDNGTIDDNANIVMSKTSNSLEVQIWSRPNKTRFIKVILRSKIKPELLSCNQLDLEPTSAMPAKVGILAGALAEHQCEFYGDTHEPTEIAQFAMEAFSESLLDAGLRDSKIFLT